MEKSFLKNSVYALKLDRHVQLQHDDVLWHVTDLPELVKPQEPGLVLGIISADIRLDEATELSVKGLAVPAGHVPESEDGEAQENGIYDAELTLCRCGLSAAVMFDRLCESREEGCGGLDLSPGDNQHLLVEFGQQKSRYVVSVDDVDGQTKVHVSNSDFFWPKDPVLGEGIPDFINPSQSSDVAPQHELNNFLRAVSFAVSRIRKVAAPSGIGETIDIAVGR